MSRHLRFSLPFVLLAAFMPAPAQGPSRRSLRCSHTSGVGDAADMARALQNRRD